MHFYFFGVSKQLQNLDDILKCVLVQETVHPQKGSNLAAEVAQILFN